MNTEVKTSTLRGLKIALSRQAKTMGTECKIIEVDEGNRAISFTAEPTKYYPKPEEVLKAVAIVNGWIVI